MISNPLIQSKTLKILYALAIVISFIKLNLGIGFALGLSASLIHQLLFIKYVDGILFNEKFSVLGFIIGYLFRYMVLVLAIASAFMWPEFVGIFGVIAGLFVLKLWLYVKELSFKKGEKR